MEEIRFKTDFQEKLFKSNEVNKRVMIAQEEYDKTTRDLIEASTTSKKIGHQ